MCVKLRVGRQDQKSEAGRFLFRVRVGTEAAVLRSRRELDRDRCSVSVLAVEGEATAERFDSVGHAYEA